MIDFLFGLPIVRPWFLAGAVWFGGGIILVVIGLWFTLEGVAYWEQQPPITPVIRTWTTMHAAIATIIGLALVSSAVAAFTHFVLDK